MSKSSDRAALLQRARHEITAHDVVERLREKAFAAQIKREFENTEQAVAIVERCIEAIALERSKK